MYEAASALCGDGFAFIDINMGCPRTRSWATPEGSALMKELGTGGKDRRSRRPRDRFARDG